MSGLNLQVRLMLVLALAACILYGIALSQAFDVFTRSIKFQLPGFEVDVGRLSVIYTSFSKLVCSLINHPVLGV